MSDIQQISTQQAESQSDRGQVNRNAAQVYEEFFVPALFQQWTQQMTESAQITAGQHILDVACGTGVLARAAARRTGLAGSVVGLDINEGMLEVARRINPDIEWRQGKAETLPFDNERFDSVASQFGLMFFVDQGAALREMFRVLRPGGHLVVAVWDALESTPGYATMVELLQRLFGDQTADALRAPFSLGDKNHLGALFRRAGIYNAQIETYPGTARFPSIDSWVYTDIKGWTLDDMIDDAQYELFLREARGGLQPFVKADGSVEFNTPAHIVTATKN